MTATRTGDQSAGITNQGVPPDFTTPPVTTLNVSGQGITPAPGVNGIEFSDGTGGDVTVQSNTGSFGITTADVTTGILASSDGGFGNSGPVTVTSIGNITVGNNGNGIFAESFSILADTGPVTVTSTGTSPSEITATASLL